MYLANTLAMALEKRNPRLLYRYDAARCHSLSHFSSLVCARHNRVAKTAGCIVFESFQVIFEERRCTYVPYLECISDKSVYRISKKRGVFYLTSDTERSSRLSYGSATTCNIPFVFARPLFYLVGPDIAPCARPGPSCRNLS